MREKSNELANYLFCKRKNEEEIGLYGFAIYIMLSSIIHIGSAIVIGIIFDMLAESILFYISFIAIRKFAGGYHANTPVKCYLFSIVSIIFSFAIIKVISGFNIGIIRSVAIILEFTAVITIVFLSPLANENKTINDREKKIYKIIAAFNSIVLFVVSLCTFRTNYSYSCSIMLGIVISACALIMRKVQNHREKLHLINAKL